MDDFASRLRYAIERSGMQQKELATSIHLSPARLSNYVNGHSEPSFDILCLICRKLSVSADYLVGLTESIDPPISIPVSIAPVSIPRPAPDPFEDLTPEQRSAIELSLKAFRDANAAKAKEA